MRILVTGGAGFIGSEFVRTALNGELEGLPDIHDLVVLDKLTYSGNLANLDPVRTDPRLRVVVGDTADETLAASVCAGRDLIVHFAAESHVDRSIQTALPFVDTNVRGTQVLLEAARRAPVQRFVHVSTDEVYGSIATGDWDESTPLAPNAPYAAAKAASDLMALSAHRTWGLDVVITRCTNNYGHYQFPEKVIPLFVTHLLDGLTVPLYGDGRNSRDWLHVSDHCRGVALAATRGRAGEVYHLGGGTELTNLELTERLLAACGADWSSVRHVADRQGHDLRYSLAITKAESELGYAPLARIDEALARTVTWYADNRAWWEPLRDRARSWQSADTGPAAQEKQPTLGAA